MIKAIVVCPDVKNLTYKRNKEARLFEAYNLALSLDIEVIGKLIVNVSNISPATFISLGGVDKIKEIAGEDAGLVIMDCALSPVQQRNLEKVLNMKVIDRTALILEIFGKRAKTKEGVLQVELAHLTYQRSRLVRSWTHLERQRGGGGFLGGPGEKQVELDRRIIDDKIIKIKKDLEKVKQTRYLHRKSRDKVPYPVVALVGYTNAGKSTLFNYLTKSEVYAKDQLFATLDPTMRELRLPLGSRVILSDTVGFISDLPHSLIAAFSATLEEVINADVILHVRDLANEETAAQKDDVLAVLKELEVEKEPIEVLNKIDLLDYRPLNSEDCCGVSALTGEGVENLLAVIEHSLSIGKNECEIKLPSHQGYKIAWLYRNGTVLSKKILEDETIINVRLSNDNLKRWEALNDTDD
ncbi:MAG: GTPase HflX [Alphaproteobacteria bacterium ADurb.Bin438]|nr:MAG: GTPase HflX [Alphaproteobacteria bacterium ADurb.Bin438]